VGSLAIPAAGRPAPQGEPQDPAKALRDLRREQRSATPPGEAEISARLTDVGVRYLETGHVAPAIELLSEAVSRDPDNGVALASLTLAYVKHGDVEFAEFYLDLARQVARRKNPDPAVYVALGDVYEAQNRPEDALAAWEQARTLGDASVELLRKIARAQSDWAFSHGQKYFSGSRFEFFFDPSISESLVRMLDEFLERASVEEARFFMRELASDQVVIVYGGRRYFEFSETPDWVGGFYDGKIRLPLEAGSEPSEALFGLLRHELAHAYLREISGRRAPSWLQEGLAQYVGGRRVDPAFVEPFLSNMPADFLENSEGFFRQRTDREQARAAYALSLSFIQFLSARGGPGSVVCLAEELGQGRTLRESFLDLYRDTPASIEAAWRADLARLAPPKKKKKK
jgi:tetratricopeptide (TPR) repeat protein